VAAEHAGRGLTAAELQAVVAELQPLVGCRVLDAQTLAVPGQEDDLLLVLQEPPSPGDDQGRKHVLHVAPGGPRARVTTTARRFAKADFADGPRRHALRHALADAELRHVAAAAGERRCAFRFATAHGDRGLVVELFGARGLWALLDAEGRCAAMSRVVETAVRTLRLGDPYVPPPAGDRAAAEVPPRFAAPVLAAVDAHFTLQDGGAATARELDLLQRAAARALQRATQKVHGLRQQLADPGRAQTLRGEADLMLAYAHTVARGATQMTVPDPDRDGAERTFALDPAVPVHHQAQRRYEQARRLDDGRAIAEQRLRDAEVAAAALAPITAALAGPPPPDAPALLALRGALQRLGAMPPPPRPKPPAKEHAAARGEVFRRFVSAEGYPILVGRNNEQNDVLTLRVANGNDLWLHVGGGRAGSHVVVRLPKQKTASLETLLDAATLAVHFSKARGEGRIDVIYTQKKHVRKPKGLPAGAVVPAQTKTVTVVHDEGRLRRLLDGAGGETD
jgi:predicted ribosome quality control (RQC) complex YloA/Tae2 family protein